MTPEFKVAEIRRLAGTMPVQDIAAHVSLARTTVYNLASTHKICLIDSETKTNTPARDFESTMQTRIDAASKLLREHGWTVLRPDPFRQLIDHKSRSAAK